MYWQSVEEFIALAEGTVSAIQADLDDFNSILPPAKFHDFHALYLTGMNDQVQALQTFITFYSIALNRGDVQMELVSRGQELTDRGNEKIIRATYKFYELCPEC
jgi:hypothetical protein